MIIQVIRLPMWDRTGNRPDSKESALTAAERLLACEDRTVTLALAVFGAALGVVNTSLLFWQWRHSGPDVSVSLHAGWQLSGNGIVSFPARQFGSAIEPSDAIQAVAVVNVTNRGRSAIDILEWWITIGAAHLGIVSRIAPETVRMATEGGLREVLPPLDDMLLYEYNEPCKFRLESHSSQRWVLRLQQVADVVSAMEGTPAIGASVRLGTGVTAVSKESVTAADLGLT